MRALFVALGLLGLAAAWPASAQPGGCHEAIVNSPLPFLGNNNEVVRLNDGGVVMIVHEYQYLYAYYPSVTVCEGAGKLIVGGRSLSMQVITPSPQARAVAAAPQIRASTDMLVALTKQGCGYFIVSYPQGYGLVEWFSGYSPSIGDTVSGALGSVGFKDVLYPSVQAQGRIRVDDYRLTREQALIKFEQKCG